MINTPLKKPLLFIVPAGILVIALFAYFIFTGKLNSTPQPQSQQEIVQKNGTAPTTMSNQGLKIEDIKVGTGPAVKNGDTVSINYVGTLTNGTKFDSSYDRGQPFETQIGTGQVIKGWDLGVVGMKVGGKRKLTIPPSLGYGDQTAGSIPPNSTLIFEVELMGIK